MKKNELVILLFCFLLAVLLRVIFLPKLSLSFYYDQARDAYIVQEIINGDLKILGPPSSTPGIFHGVFYYYLLAIPYFFGHGNPVLAAYFIAFLNAVTLFIIFFLTYFLTKKKGASILASLLFAVSFEATQYATWLSNPTIGIWTVPLFYLGLWLWIKEPNQATSRKWGPILAGLGVGLSIQAEVFLVYHLVPLVFWLWYSRKHIKKYELLLFMLVLLIFLSTMIAAEIKFGFKSILGLKELLLSNESIQFSKSLGDFLVLYFNQLGRVFAFSTIPGNLGYGGILVLAIIVISFRSMKKRKLSWQAFLSTWIFSHLTVVSVGGTSTPFLLVGIGPAVSMFVGISLHNLWTSGKKVFVAALILIIIFANLSMILRENSKGQTIFSIQNDMTLSNQLPLIDYTYQESINTPFSINSLTSPLYVNIVWSYLYKWYGLPKYGYLPEWKGRDQVGQLDSLPATNTNTTNHFLIIEPLGGIPERYLSETVIEEDAYSIFVEEKSFNDIKVQKRIKKIKNE